jgi:DNA-directed RNA polymerase beta' subunit
MRLERYLIRKGRREQLSPQIQLQVGDKLERNLKNGDRVAINRHPVLHTGSLISAQVRVLDTLPLGGSARASRSESTFEWWRAPATTEPNKTVALNPAICKGLAADFDGDTIGRCT